MLDPVACLVGCLASVRLGDYRSVEVVCIDRCLVCDSRLQEVEGYGYCACLLIGAGSEEESVTCTACDYEVVADLSGKGL